LFDLITTEKLIHPHLGGADIQAALFHAAINLVDIPTDLNLLVFTIGMKNPSPSHNSGGDEERKIHHGRGAIFVTMAVHGWISNS
jgi:hypothetical protein